MVRFLFQRLKNIGKTNLNNSNETNTEASTKETNSNKSEKNSVAQKSWLSYFYKTKNNIKPITVDVAVGPDDEKPKENFLYYFLLGRKEKAKEVAPPTAEEKSHALDKFMHGLQREASIVTREVVSSSFSSIFSVLFSHPFDVIKSQYQLLRYPRTTLHSPYFKRRKFFYVLRNIYVTKGLRRFYKHLWVSQRESLFQVISMFWTYQRVRQFVNENFESVNDECTNFLSGFLSATIPVWVIHPYDEFRERQDMKRIVKQKYGKTAAATLIKEVECWRPLYRNCFAMFAHMGTQYGLRFMFYNKIHDELSLRKTIRDKATDTNPYVTEVDSITNLTSGELLLAGALAAILGDTLAYPLDVVRCRLAMKSLMRQQYRYDQTCRRFWQCLKLIWKQESLRAFYAGWLPCLIRSTVNTALQFAAYEKMRDWLRLFFSA